MPGPRAEVTSDAETPEPGSPEIKGKIIEDTLKLAQEKPTPVESKDKSDDQHGV